MNQRSKKQKDGYTIENVNSIGATHNYLIFEDSMENHYLLFKITMAVLRSELSTEIVGDQWFGTINNEVSDYIFNKSITFLRDNEGDWEVTVTTGMGLDKFKQGLWDIEEYAKRLSGN